MGVTLGGGSCNASGRVGPTASGLSDWLALGSVRLQFYGSFLVVPHCSVWGPSVWVAGPGGPLPLLPPPQGSLEE